MRVARRLPLPTGSGASGLRMPGPLALPAVTQMGLVQLGPRWRQEEHAHDVHELHYTRRGAGTLVCGGRKFVIKTGTIYLLTPGEFHGGFTDSGDPMQVLYVCVKLPPSLQSHFIGNDSGAPIFLADASAVELRSALKALGDSLAAVAAHSGVRVMQEQPGPAIQSRVLRVLSALLEPLEQLQQDAGTPRARDLAESVMRELELSRGKPPALKQLAQKLNVTPQYLGEALGAATGRTWPEAVAAIRVRNAKELLANPDIPIREVARRVGLSSARALARLFRRVTGQAPRDSRQG